MANIATTSRRMKPEETVGFLEQLRSVVGATNVLTDEGDLAPYVVDARKRYRGGALCVVRPASTQEVSSVLALCHGVGIAVVPQGGNTGMCGGATPYADRPSIVLALSRMNRVREVDALNSTISVDAGCTLASVQSEAAAVGRLFPMSLGSEGSCQIGGNIATNAGGTAVLRYGPMRDLVLGIEAVLPDGRIVNAMKSLRKDNTGYALKHLFIGSEGTLGVITGAVLKLFAKPQSDAVVMVGLEDIDAALNLLQHVQARAGDRLTNFEVMCRNEYDLVMRLPKGLQDPLAERHPWMAIVELTHLNADADLDDELATIIHEAMESGLVKEAVLATSEAQAELIWEIRHSVTEANVNAGLTFSHDTSVPVSRVPDFVRGVERLVAERFPQAMPVFVGHVGDGNIHAVVVLPREGEHTKDVNATAAAVNAVIDEVALSLDGSISAEHGIGRSNRARLKAYLDPADHELMQGIKALFDPKGLMNPGVLL